MAAAVVAMPLAKLAKETHGDGHVVQGHCEYQVAKDMAVQHVAAHVQL